MLSRRNVDTDAPYTQRRRGCSRSSTWSPCYPGSDTQFASLEDMEALEWNHWVRGPCSHDRDFDCHLTVERLRVQLLAVNGCMGYAAPSFCPECPLDTGLQRRLFMVAARFRRHGISTQFCNCRVDCAVTERIGR